MCTFATTAISDFATTSFLYMWLFNCGTFLAIVGTFAGRFIVDHVLNEPPRRLRTADLLRRIGAPMPPAIARRLSFWRLAFGQG